MFWGSGKWCEPEQLVTVLHFLWGCWILFMTSQMTYFFVTYDTDLKVHLGVFIYHTD